MIRIQPTRRWPLGMALGVLWFLPIVGIATPSSVLAVDLHRQKLTGPASQQDATDRSTTPAGRKQSARKKIIRPRGRAPEVVTVPLPRLPGATIKYLALGPANPAAAVILFAGGNGVLDLQGSGTIGTNLRDNFLVRSRTLFADQGLFVAVLDASSDQPASGLNGQIRLGDAHRQDIREVIKSVKFRTGSVPVWLVGTSSGTLSVVNAAPKPASLGPPVLNHAPTPPPTATGIVLASPQTAYHTYYLADGVTVDPVHTCMKSVNDDPTLSSITGSALVVVNQNDQCACSPPGNGDVLVSTTFTNASRRRLITITSAAQFSMHVCDAYTPHGYYSIDGSLEGTVVSAIANWIIPPPPWPVPKKK